MKNDYWRAVPDDADFAQGDVLRRSTAKSAGSVEFGIVITADCDIVQKKAGNRYTYVEVLPAEGYLDLVWCPEQLAKFVSKQAKGAADQVRGHMRRAGIQLHLTEEQLLTWLAERPVTAIEAAVGEVGMFDAKLSAALTALRLAIGADGPPEGLARWRAVRQLMGGTPQKMREDLKGAFDGEKGFPDYFLLPELPGATGYGYTAMLRFMRTVDAGELFRSEVDARIAGQPNALHRVGRLTDGIRFAITQKLAFLFSRIGLPQHFEQECRSATDLLAESLTPGA